MKWIEIEIEHCKSGQKVKFISEKVFVHTMVIIRRGTIL